MIPIRQPLYQVGLLLVVSLFSISVLQAGQNPSSDQAPQATAAPGRSTFNSFCAACHGLDGSGSDKAVDISGTARVRQLSDTQLSGIISNGVPGTGMPAFRNLNETQVRAIIAYLRSPRKD
jgi:mono/diheme cytochrome c family protein